MAERVAPYDFETRGLFDLVKALEPEIEHYEPGCALLFGEEAAAQRRSPPFVIWQPAEGLWRQGAESRKQIQKAFKTCDQAVRAQIVGKPLPSIPDPSEASYRGTEALLWAVVWSLQKAYPGAHTLARSQYERREGTRPDATGLSQAHWCCWLTFTVELAFMRPFQASAPVEKVEVEHEIKHDLPIPMQR